MFEPLDLIARLARWCRRRDCMIRFHGVLAAHAEVVPKLEPSAEPKTDATRAAEQLGLFGDPRPRRSRGS